MNPFRQLKRYLIYKIKNKIDIDTNVNFKSSKIDEYFKYFDSDKGSKWKKNKHVGHGYSEFYEKHLNIFKNQKINILEIGSGRGEYLSILEELSVKAIGIENNQEFPLPGRRHDALERRHPARAHLLEESDLRLHGGHFPHQAIEEGQSQGLHGPGRPGIRGRHAALLEKSGDLAQVGIDPGA